MPLPPDKAMEPEKRILLRKASDFCATQERCIREVSQKLSLWGADRKTAGEILDFLLRERFIDEQRFAIAYARGKFRNLQWGRIKIGYELKAKGISGLMINKALSEIPEEEYSIVIRTLAGKKLKSLGENNYDNRMKTLRFLAGKGFEPDLIIRILEK